MKKLLLLSVLFLTMVGLNSPLLFGQNQSFMDNFIRGAEAGARARAMQDQAALARAQAEYYKALTEGMKQAQQQQQRRTLTQAEIQEINRQGEATLNTFSQRHPDWPKYEPKMLGIATRLLPNGMSDLEYLEILYVAVTYEETVKALAESKKQLVQRDMDEFARRHPDWLDYQARMSEMADTFRIGEGKSMLDYMEGLYTLAKAKPR